MAEAAAAVEGGPTVQPLVMEYDPFTGERGLVQAVLSRVPPVARA